jgi:hypothetical protein
LMSLTSASIAHRITADCGAGHRGAVMLFSIATVVTVSSRRRLALRRVRGDRRPCSRNRRGVVHLEPYCRRSRFSDSFWTMIETSTVKATIGGAAEDASAAGAAAAKAEIPLLPLRLRH